MNIPIITITITCYQEGSFLSEALDSVFAQTDNRWKLILVKDGGSDYETDRIFCDTDHPQMTKYAFAENVGPYIARNKAVEMADTEYIMHLDGDDKLPGDSIEKIFKKFRENPEVDFTYGDFKLIGELTGHCTFPPKATWEAVIPRHDLPGTLAYKKRLWQKLGGYALELNDGMADYDFNIGLIEHGYRGEHIGQGYVYYHYRQKKSGHVSHSYGVRIYEKRKIIVARHPLLFANQKRRNLFLGFGALVSADYLGQRGDFAGCRRMAMKALQYGYYRRGAFFMALFAVPASLIKRKLNLCEICESIDNRGVAESIPQEPHP